MTAIIDVQNLGKRYTISHKSASEVLDGKSSGQDSIEEFWALKNVTFDVQPGERLAFIGGNGAGKSTLLKLLSRITSPSTGSMTIRGRVASLLEVGTGFHPELSGRENVFLNGAILGMSKAEIRRKFDEIVAFSGVERFLDTPVKRFSSGMYVRLAFSVAAHLDSEILIVDEVLAVGDADFQKKCQDKIESVSREGRTALFVSHNMSAVINLCERAVLLQNGELILDAPVRDVVQRYVGATAQGGSVEWLNNNEAPGNEHVRIRAGRIWSNDKVNAVVDVNKPMIVEFDYLVQTPGLRITTHLNILDQYGNIVLVSSNMNSSNLTTDPWFDKPHAPGLYRSQCVVPSQLLNEGNYVLSFVALSDISNMEAFASEVLSFNVIDSNRASREFAGKWFGVIRPILSWQTQPVESMEQATTFLSQEQTRVSI